MTTSRPLPTAAEFLKAAVRFLRPKRKYIEGVRLVTLYEAARELYDEKEIRKALNATLKDGTLVLVSEVAIKKAGNVQTTLVRITSVDDAYPLDKRMWWTTLDGILIEQKKVSAHEEHRRYGRLKLYVTEDRLPKFLKNVVDCIRPLTKSEQILESMQKKK